MFLDIRIFIFFSFSLCPAYSKVGRATLVLKHFVSHAPPNFLCVLSGEIQRHALSCY